MNIHRYMLMKLNLFLGTVIGLLGCGSKRAAVDTPNRPIMCMYGVPTATYRISGQVMDQAAHPVDSARVIVKNNAQNAIAAISTDNKGHFEVSYTGFPTDTLRIVANDTNGELRTDSVLVATKEQRGSTGFDLGETKYKVDIKLKK